MPEKREEERVVLAVSLPKGAALMIAKAAARRHKARSAFVRDAAIEAAEKVLAASVATVEAA